MFGEEFGFDYAYQRHAELVRAAEHQRLIRHLEEIKRAEQKERPLRKRVLAATGDRLVAVGCRLQQAAAQAAVQ
jgi:hypothetical protein